MKNYWTQAYNNIRQRCTNPKASKYKNYGGKGIKCLTNSKELKELFERDNAHLLNQPSIDRIKSDGDYEKSNMRWIEFSENRRLRAASLHKPKINKTEFKKETITVRLPQGYKIKISDKAHNLKISFSMAVRFALTNWLSV